MKKIILILLLISASAFAQKSINNYKYIIVPNKFEFVKKNDQYQTSSLTKFLFNKSGFTAFLANEPLPKEIAKNRCFALTGSVRDDSGMLTTKSIVELKDCYGNVVFTSKVGVSKNKDYKKSYHESIRDAFKSIKALNYNYVPLKEKPEKLTEQSSVVLNPKVIRIKTVKENTVNKTKESTLYAQPTANGYQLVNTKPEVVFQLLKTNVKEVFILKNKNGILYKDDNNWFADYYKGGIKIVEKYEVKF